MTKKTKLSLREKVALACFMECVPLLIDKWRKDAPEKTFDDYLLDIWTEEKVRESNKK